MGDDHSTDEVEEQPEEAAAAETEEEDGDDAEGFIFKDVMPKIESPRRPKATMDDVQSAATVWGGGGRS